MKSSIIVVSSEAAAEQGDQLPKGKVVKKAGKRVGYNYIIIKSFKESQKNDVVKCWYIKSLTNFGVCVIKEGSYGDTKDRNGRDIIDRLKWQKKLHTQLEQKIRIPKLLGSFEEKGNFYLVIEHIPGKSLHHVLAENRKFEKYVNKNGHNRKMMVARHLVKLTEIMAALHAEGIVHRDCTPNNFVIGKRGKVTLIDLELSYSLGLLYPDPAFALGTHGYMSRQQESMQTPTLAEDIFALGSIILVGLSGAAPNKLVKEPYADLCQKLSFFIGDQQLCNLVQRCLHPEEAQRPQATDVLSILRQYQADLTAGANRPIQIARPYTERQIADTVQSAIDTLATPLLADAEKGWFSEKKKNNQDKSKFQKAWYASFNRGAAGILYTMARAREAGMNITQPRPYLERSIQFIREKYIQQIEQASTGLHFGGDGIAVALTTAVEAGMIAINPQFQEWIEKLLEKHNPTPYLSHGTAGQGMANLLCNRLLPRAIVEPRLRAYSAHLMSLQSKDGPWINGYHPRKLGIKKKRVPKGFFDGMPGIISFLLEYGNQYNNPAAITSAVKGLDWLSKQAKVAKGIAAWNSSRGSRLYYHLGGGVAGIALIYLRAYEIVKLGRFRQMAIATLQGVRKDILDSNLSQAMGLSGLGEVYLEAYRILKDHHWLHRADWIAQVIMQYKKVHPEYGVYWLVEGEKQPVANFMEGECGVLHFLMRFCQPDKFSFPLLPVRHT